MSPFAIIHVIIRVIIRHHSFIIRHHYVSPASSGAWAANLGKAASDERAAQYPREPRMARCSGPAAARAARSRALAQLDSKKVPNSSNSRAAGYCAGGRPCAIMPVLCGVNVAAN